MQDFWLLLQQRITNYNYTMNILGDMWCSVSSLRATQTRGRTGDRTANLPLGRLTILPAEAGDHCNSQHYSQIKAQLFSDECVRWVIFPYHVAIFSAISQKLCTSVKKQENDCWLTRTMLIHSSNQFPQLVFSSSRSRGAGKSYTLHGSQVTTPSRGRIVHVPVIIA